jgi:SnoaL-like domain
MSEHVELETRLLRLEDESAILRLIMSYGPAADAGLSAFASGLWLEDGVYDWDADGEPHRGSTAVDSMLQSTAHRELMSEGVIEVTGDTATAVNYSLIMRREERRFYLWRVSAVRWDLERSGSTWRVQRRTNRLLDNTGGGRQLFGSSLHDLFPEGPR